MSEVEIDTDGKSKLQKELKERTEKFKQLDDEELIDLSRDLVKNAPDDQKRFVFKPRGVIMWFDKHAYITTKQKSVLANFAAHNTK